MVNSRDREGKNYSVLGSCKGITLDFLKFAEDAYRAMEEFDRAPEIAEEIFAGLKDPNLIEEERAKLYSQAGKQRQREIGVAGNYAMVSALFKEGSEEFAKELIRMLVKGDLSTNLIDSYLKKLGTSYLGLCREKKILLTPRALDRVVFERYAPQSIDVVEGYTDKEAVVFAYPQKKGFEKRDISVRAIYDNLRGRKIVEEGTPIAISNASIKTNVLNFEFRGGNEKLEEIVKKQLEKLGVKEHSLIRTSAPKEGKTLNLAHYVLFRFLTKRHGRFLNALAPGLGGDNHRIISRPIEDNL